MRDVELYVSLTAISPRPREILQDEITHTSELPESYRCQNKALTNTKWHILNQNHKSNKNYLVTVPETGTRQVRFGLQILC